MSLFDRLRHALAAKPLAVKPDLGIPPPSAPSSALPSSRLEQALTLHESGDLTGAAAIYADLLAKNPRDADALHLSGLVAHQFGDQSRALELISRAVAERPEAPRFRFNLGNVFASLDRTHEAAASFQRAVELDPAHAPCWFNLGSALARLEQHARAVVALRRAHAIDAHLPGMKMALAQALVNAAGNHELPQSACVEAADLLADHWASAPDPQEARLLLAYALQETRQFTAAAEHYAAMLRSAPDLEVAHNNLANCYNQLGRTREAIVEYREVLRLQPDNALAASGIVSSMNYDCEATPDEMLRAHRDWAARFAPDDTPKDILRNRRDPARRLRVAYVSPDFRRHLVATLFAPVIERHNRERFEIICYYNYPRADLVTQRLRARADQWVDIHQWNDATFASRIRDDQIDILVDLGGHTSYGRLRAYATRPAPVIASWLGYYSTTGLTQIDAFISDPVSSPPGQDAWFSERLLRLPATRFTFEPHEFYPPPGPARGRRPGAVTFGCLNNLSKINHKVIAAWSAILGHLPESTLLIQSLALEDAPNREAFLRQCEAAGIRLSQLEVRGWSRLEDAARVYHEIDIALDPFPFCGGMTSFDSLWMGVPVVTLAGPLVAGRQTASMLANLGLDDLVTTDGDAYVRCAVGLAMNPARLDELRTTLRPRIAASPLCDHEQFTRALEAAYLGLWRDWCGREA